MKRLLVCLLTLALLVSVAIVGTSAADYETDPNAWKNVQLHALYAQSGCDIFSDMAEDYYGLWWEDEIPELDGSICLAATINMRGFAVSANSDYAYMGTLNGGSGVRGVVVMDMVSGQVTDLYYHYDTENADANVPFSYAKGIDTDERGYVYVGFAYSKNYNVVNLGIAEQKSDGTLEEKSFTPVCNLGTPGDESGTHVGVNGVDVVKIDDQYYCYVVVNYDHDALYCFNVTDPANPVLNTEFGDGGMIKFADGTVADDGRTLKEGQYLDVMDDGTIYLCTTFSDGADGIMIIEPDGSACRGVIEMPGVYSIQIVGDFLLCGMKDGTIVDVIDRESGEEVAKIPLFDGHGDRVVRMQVINGVLYVCDAGDDANGVSAIQVGALNDDGLEFIRSVVDALNNPEEETDASTEESQAPGDDTKAPDESNADTKAPDESNADTKAPEGTDTKNETEADTPASTKENSDIGKGCASVLASGSAIVLLMAAAYVVSKKH